MTRILPTRAVWRVLLGLMLLMPVLSQAAVQVATNRFALRRDGVDCFLPYVSSHSLTEPNPNIRRLVVAIHSSSYDAFAYLKIGQEAARKAGVLDETLVLAPHFLRVQHIKAQKVPDGMLYWDANPFWGSQLSLVTPGAQKVRFSSYELLDQLVATVVDRERFPNLKAITFIGHSAGGQFTQRYAAAGLYEPPAGINVRYVVAAPSSYAYLTSERAVAEQPGTFAIPTAEAVKACPSYNDWGYGLAESYRYVKEGGVAQIARRFAGRRVFYICGELDRDPNHSSLSRTCASMMQGAQRFERMETFKAYLGHTFGPEIYERHQFAVAPGVAHSGFGNLTCDASVAFIFGGLAAEKQ